MINMPTNSETASHITPQPMTAVPMNKNERIDVPNILGIATLALCFNPLKVAVSTPVKRKTT